ncbi:MAG: tyrosine-type recombinase/integrase [Xanthobacteraceae bacterium]
MKMRLRYISEDVDRHGNVRCYIRLPGRPKVRIRSLPGTPEFLAEYQDAINGESEPSRAIRSNEIKRGTFRHLVVAYFKSGEYAALDVSTRNWQRRALERICETHGNNLVSQMQPRHVRLLRDELLSTPAAANQRLKALRALFSWGNENDETTVNPVLGVKRLKYASEGHHSWTDAEIAQYQKRHPVGTKARLAFDLLRFIAFRREDVVRIGPDHISDGRVQYRQAKNEDRNPVDIDIPLHPDLAASIAATATGDKTFLVTEFGKAFTANGFGGKFKDWCRQANLPHCSAHGIRKATATTLAENAASPHEIMSITGHRTLAEVERYAKAARMRKLADTAMEKLTPQPQHGSKIEHRLSHHVIQWDDLVKKPNKTKAKNDLWRSLGETSNAAKYH